MTTSSKCNVCGQDNPAEARFCASCGAALEAEAKPPQPAAVPKAAIEYMGFWIRLGAAIIDTVVIWLISFVLSYFLLSNMFGYRYAFFMSSFWFPVPWLYYWLFIGLKGQTPGKMAVGIKVVDARGDRPGLGRAALREIPGKLISTIVLFIGFLWIALDDNKQGWHDKIAGTYVVKVVKVESEE